MHVFMGLGALFIGESSCKQVFLALKALKHFERKLPRCTIKVIEHQAGDTHERHRQHIEFRQFWQICAGF